MRVSLDGSVCIFRCWSKKFWWRIFPLFCRKFRGKGRESWEETGPLFEFKYWRCVGNIKAICPYLDRLSAPIPFVTPKRGSSPLPALDEERVDI